MALIVSAAVTRRKSLREIFSAKVGPFFKTYSTPETCVHTAAAPPLLYKSASCPDIAVKDIGLPRNSRPYHDDWLKARSVTNFKSQPKLKSAEEAPVSESQVVVPNMFENIAMASCPTTFSALACPCPCPCGPCGPCGSCCGNPTDCNCGCKLPPPCNTPPKCLQYMTGYYYYPYGTWFCGPYHVNTGGVPCAGPVCPGTSCGMAAPNPGAVKCAPCCKPCGCCCGLLSCSICNPASFGNPQQQQTAAYNPYANQQAPPCPPMLHSLPQDAYHTSCGTGYNVNFSPVPLAGPTEFPNYPCPTTPQWTKDHGPCKCADCVTRRNTNVANPIDRLSKVDAPTAIKNILEPFSRAFPYKKPVNLADSISSPRDGGISKSSKVKPTFP